MITVYVITYNEEIRLPFFIKHYRQRFPECNIIVYDNYSNDNTENIAIENNCTIVKYDTSNQLSDAKYLDIKNNCWKSSSTNWVLVCDCDEFLDINSEQLLYEENLGSTIIRGHGWGMINMNTDSCNLDEMTNGVRDQNYDKCVLFNKKFIYDINYAPGCHSCHPVGKNIQLSKQKYNLFHFHNINEYYIIDRHKVMVERMSDLNKQLGWGIQYFMTKKQIHDQFESMRKNSMKVRFTI